MQSDAELQAQLIYHLIHLVCGHQTNSSKMASDANLQAQLRYFVIKSVSDHFNTI